MPGGSPGRGLFFRACRNSGSGLDNDLLSVLLGEGLEVLVTFKGSLHGRNLLARDVASEVFSVFTGLKLIERTRGAVFDDGELAPFHGLDLGNLLKKVG